MIKFMFSVLAVLSATPSFAGGISTQTKKIILDAMTREVFFEDEGAIRAPQDIADFKYKKVSSALIMVTGDSYSEWDLKPIHYDCSVKILNAKGIRSTDDIDVTCSLEGENWPND